MKQILFFLLTMFYILGCARNPFRKPEAFVVVSPAGRPAFNIACRFNAAAAACQCSAVSESRNVDINLQEIRGKAGATFTTYTIHYTSNGRDFNSAWPGFPEVDLSGGVENGRVEKSKTSVASVFVLGRHMIDWGFFALTLPRTCGLTCCLGNNPIPSNQIVVEANITLLGKDDGGHNLEQSLVVNIQPFFTLE